MEQKPKSLQRNVLRDEYFFIHGFEDSDITFDVARGIYNLIEFKVLAKLGLSLKGNDVKVLEIGSGKGLFLKYLKELNIDIVGIDANPRSAEKNKIPPQAAARIEQMPFKDGAFDVVISLFDVFDKNVYIQDQNAMMQEIKRVLKPGGVYFSLGNNYKNQSSLIPNFPKDRVLSDDVYSVYQKS